jgi:hypothetical protein
MWKETFVTYFYEPETLQLIYEEENYGDGSATYIHYVSPYTETSLTKEDFEIPECSKELRVFL